MSDRKSCADVQQHKHTSADWQESGCLSIRFQTTCPIDLWCYTTGTDLMVPSSLSHYMLSEKRINAWGLLQLDLMDDGQWQSDGPVRRAGLTDPDLLNDSESSRSPDENQNRLVEEAEEVEQGPRGGQKPLRQDHTNNNSDDEDYDSSRVEDEEEEEEEEEEGDSNSGAFSPELDGHIRDSPTPSPSPTVSEGLVSPEGPPQGDAGSPQGFGRPLSASLQELGEQGDHPLLPHCLHQVTY
ncbi:unnamed protein product [Leuciscus chuanchicus]